MGHRLDAAVFYLTNFGPVAGSTGKQEQCGKTEEWGVCLFRALFLGLCFPSRYHAPLLGGLLLVGHVILGVILFWVWAMFLRVSLWFNTFITDFSKVYYPEAIYRLPHSPGLWLDAGRLPLQWRALFE